MLPVRRTLAVTAIVALGLVTAACSTSGSSGNGGGENAVATSTVDLPPSYRFAPAAISVKAALTLLGRPVGAPRLPYVEASPDEVDTIRAALISAGLL